MIPRIQAGIKRKLKKDSIIQNEGKHLIATKEYFSLLAKMKTMW